MDGLADLLPKDRSAIPADVLRAYRETDYRAGTGAAAIRLRIDERADALARLYDTSGQRCALFITACNPFGEPHGVHDNEAAHIRLRAVLDTLTEHVIEGAGAHPAGDWPEEKSFLALGIDLDTARDLGREFSQNAIVWAGHDLVPRLVLLR